MDLRRRREGETQEDNGLDRRVFSYRRGQIFEYQQDRERNERQPVEISCSRRNHVLIATLSGSDKPLKPIAAAGTRLYLALSTSDDSNGGVTRASERR
jgi:hypothetical protein